MIAITTSNSMSVKPFGFRPFGNCDLKLNESMVMNPLSGLAVDLPADVTLAKKGGIGNPCAVQRATPLKW